MNARQDDPSLVRWRLAAALGPERIAFGLIVALGIVLLVFVLLNRA